MDSTETFSCPGAGGRGVSSAASRWPVLGGQDSRDDDPRLGVSPTLPLDCTVFLLLCPTTELLSVPYLIPFYCLACFAALTSPIEYQRSHSGGSGGGGSGGGAPGSGGGGSNHSSGLPSSSRSRPSRIPQPVRHHSPVLVSSAASSQAEADKMSGMSTPGPSLPPPSSSLSLEAGPSQPGRLPHSGPAEGPEREAEQIPKMKVIESPRKSAGNAAGASQDGNAKEAKEARAHPEDGRSRSSLGSLPLGKPRPGAISPLNSPLSTVFPSPLGKEPFPPSSPLQKGGSFWSSIPASPASRPGSFTFPGDSDSLQRQAHRHSAPGKDTDRMSTCSSASEQSVQSTQSNGVRTPGSLRPPAPLPLSRQLF
ncbi:hypothetical protein QTO34_014016 [Cnephaeus nilssonii]|uniref:Uncharacterized protein n=1 Tax=Cnephaeus nilssonii TaxID=3371016 RepID=A0AA40IA86_CNENI|nr:hypothetical protein QTO34_014016 [Eptesicus nilssonii]